MTDNTEETGERRFASGSKHREAGVVLMFSANCYLFVRFAENMFFWQIVIWQIVIDILCVGKL